MRLQSTILQKHNDTCPYLPTKRSFIGFPFHLHNIKVFYHYAIENFIYLNLLN